MLLLLLLASLHLMFMATAVGGVLMRGSLAHHCRRAEDLRPALRAHALWIAMLLATIVVGLIRAFGHVEPKDASFYLHNPFFHIKMTLVATIILLEIWPFIVIARWRAALARGGQVDLARAKAIGIISHSQSALMLLTIVAAVAMARGLTPRSLFG